MDLPNLVRLKCVSQGRCQHVLQIGYELGEFGKFMAVVSD